MFFKGPLVSVSTDELRFLSCHAKIGTETLRRIFRVQSMPRLSTIYRLSIALTEFKKVSPHRAIFPDTTPSGVYTYFYGVFRTLHPEQAAGRSIHAMIPPDQMFGTQYYAWHVISRITSVSEVARELGLRYHALYAAVRRHTSLARTHVPGLLNYIHQQDPTVDMNLFEKTIQGPTP